MKHKIYYEIQIVVLDDVNDGKDIENTFLLAYILLIPSNCLFLLINILFKWSQLIQNVFSSVGFGGINGVQYI